MLTRTTLLLLTGAILLGGGVLLFENTGGSTDRSGGKEATATLENAAENMSEGESLFPFTEAAVEQLTIERADDTLAFTKNEAGDWEMTEPETAPAEAGAIAFLLSQLTSPTVTTLQAEADALADFGLAQPGATVDLVADGKAYRLFVGGPDFSGDKRYVQAVDVSSDQADSEAEQKTAADSAEPTSAPPAELIDISVMAGGLLNAVDRPTQEWISSGADTDAAPTSLPPEKNDTDSGTDSDSDTDSN